MSVNKRKNADVLRTRTEALLIKFPEEFHPSDLKSVIELAHDLAVHQADLEHQRDRFAALYEHAPVGYVVLDTEGIIRQTNATMLALLNRDEEDLRGKPITEVMIPEDAPVFLSRFRTFFLNPVKKQIIVRMRRKGSTPFYAQIETSSQSGQRLENPDEDRSNRELMIVVSDISELREAQQEIEDRNRELQRANDRIEHINRVLLGIRNVNQLIVSEEDPFFLIENACENLTETMGYLGAVMVLLDGAGLEVTAAAASGFEENFESVRTRIMSGDLPQCMRRSLQSDKTIIIADPATECPECPLSSECGDRAGLCSRLTFEGKMYGMLAVSVPRNYASSEEEQDLFNEVAGDLAFALHKIEMDELRRWEHERLEFIINGSRLGTWEWNVQTDETVFNDTWAAMVGYTLEELTPYNIDTWKRLTHPDDLARAQEQLVSCIEGETPEYQCELRMKHKDGHWIWILDSGKVMTYDDDGKPLSMFGTHADITELKQAENDLRVTTDRLQAILDHSPLLMSEISLDGTYLRVNAATAGMFGRSAPSMVGTSFDALLPEDTVNVFMERIARVTETREPLSVENYLDEGGAERHYLTTLYPLFDSTGNVRSIGAIAHDITGRVEAEKKVRQQAERLQALVDILQYHPETIQDFLDHALDKAISLTDSKIGYIYFYDEDGKQFELNSWSKDVMSECSVVNPQTCYELDNTGIWGEAVRQRKPILLNNFQSEHPLKKGFPEGHVSLTRFLTVPVFHNERIVAVVGVANKSSDYDQTDVLELTLLMDTVWKSVETMRGEQALRDREEHISLLGSMLDAAPTSITIHNTEGRFVFANQATLDSHGYDSLTEFLSVNLRELDVPESEALLEDRFRKIAEEGEARFEVNHYRKDGSTFPLEITAKSIDWQGSPAVLSIAIDITSRKQAEDALIHARDLLRYIIEHANSGVAVHDKDLRYIYVSEPYLDMYKVKEKDIIGRHHYDVFPDLPEKWREAHQRALKGEVSSGDRDPYYRSDGTVEWTRWECRPWYENDGSIGGIIVYTEVITERIHAEEALRKSEERFRSLFESMIAGSCIDEIIYDKRRAVDYRILDVNPSYERIMGISHDKAVHALGSQLYGTGKAPWLDTFTRVAETGETARFETFFEPIQRYLEFTVSRPAEGRFSTVFTDITERKQVELERERLSKAIEQSGEIIVITGVEGNIQSGSEDGICWAACRWCCA